jgi:hypothetical protein
MGRQADFARAEMEMIEIGGNINLKFQEQRTRMAGDLN